ncbi:MAG: nuclear transport factor 2 family protein, partial [Methylotenera sp.]
PVAATSFIEPDRTLDAASNMPTAAELALVKQLDKIKALPVLQQVKAATISAKQEVTAAVEQWHQAQLDKNAETYLSLYADSFTPAGQSHNHWAELQKMQFVTADVKSVQISKVVVAAEDTTMVAVFTQTLKHSDKQEHVRKILTFQQKHGQWQIVSEHDMPVSNQTLANPSKRQSGFLTDPPPKRNKVKASKINTALNLSNTLNSVVEAK